MDVGNVDNAKIEICLKNFLTHIAFVSPFFKNPSFQEECEWRICFIAAQKVTSRKTFFEQLYKNLKENDPFRKNFGQPLIVFSEKEDEFLPHINLPISDLRSCIKSITIGSKNKMTTDELKMFLIHNDLLESTSDKAISIGKSKSSYR